MILLYDFDTENHIKIYTRGTDMRNLYFITLLFISLAWSAIAQAQTYFIENPVTPASTSAVLDETQPDYFAQNQGNLTEKEISESGIKAQRKYWTAERLRNAKPIDLPKADASVHRLDVIETYGYEESVNEPGSKPLIRVKPNREKLFQPIKTEIRANSENEAFTDYESAVDLYSYGTVGAYFTSSQVGPAPAAQHSWPFAPTGKLFFSSVSGAQFSCTASVIKPRLILTAGHCVYDAKNKQWYQNFKFIPAYHNGSAPYGTWYAQWISTTNNWFNGGGSLPNRGDYALLEIQDNYLGQKIGSITGHYGYRTSALSPNHVTMLGYPAALDSGNWMHRVDSQSFKSTLLNTVEYGTDMAQGSSGGPWVENFGLKSLGQSVTSGEMNYVVGVTSYGPTYNGPNYSGSSILDTQFTNSSRTGILDTACARSVGNC